MIVFRCIFGLLFVLSVSGLKELRAFDDFQQLSAFPVQTPSGLPQNSVLSMAQLRDGRMIIGTGNGFVLYNGLDTEWIKHPLNKGSVRYFYPVADFICLIQIGNNCYRFDTLDRSITLLKADDYLLSVNIQRRTGRFNRDIATFSEDWKNYSFAERLLPDAKGVYFKKNVLINHLRTNSAKILIDDILVGTLKSNEQVHIVYSHQLDDDKFILVTNTFRNYLIDRAKQTIRFDSEIDNSPKNDVITDAIALDSDHILISTKFNVFFKYRLHSKALDPKETVRTHIRNIYEKMEVKSTIEAVSKYLNRS